MRTGRIVAVAWFVAVCAAGSALAQEGPQPGRMRGGFAMRARPAPRGATDTLSQLAEAIPAVREELERHRKAMIEIYKGHLSLANEIDAALRELRAAGGNDEEMTDAAKALAPQANKLAAQRAAELATHYANLAKTLNPEDEAKRKEVAAQLAEGLIKRMATAKEEPGAPPVPRFDFRMLRRPGGEGMGGRPGGRMPRDGGAGGGPRGGGNPDGEF